MPRPTWGVLAMMLFGGGGLATPVAGCSEVRSALDVVLQRPVVVRDTTGAEFELDCGDAGCDVRPRSAPILAGCADHYWYYANRFLVIYSGPFYDGGPSIDPREGRLVACDSGCPRVVGSTFECRSGLCQSTDPNVRFDFYEAQALCYDAIPRPRTCDDLSDPVYAAPGAAARTTCAYDSTPTCTATVPPGCRQP